MFRRPLRAAAAALLSFAPVLAWGGSVWTFDGKTYEGDVTVAAGGGLLVKTSGQEAAEVPVSNLLFAALSAPAATMARPPVNALSVREIGDVPGKCTTSFVRGTYSVTAEGGAVDAEKRSDSFYLLGRTFHGDGEITCRLLEFPRHTPAARVGLVMRARSNPGARGALVYLAGDGRVGSAFRFKDDTRSLQTQGPEVTPPVWLKLTRAKEVCTASWSRDGKRWESLGVSQLPYNRAVNRARENAEVDANTLRRGIDMGSTTHAGLFIAGGSGKSVSAGIDHVEFVETRGSAPQPGKLVAESFASPPAWVSGRGVTARSGSFFARGQLQQIDRERLVFTHGGHTLRMLASQAALAALMPPGESLADGRAGVLLTTGDFVEGDIRRLEGGKVTVSSVVFGNSRYELGGQVAALMWRKIEPAEAPFHVMLADGSLLLADTLRLEPQRCLIEERSAGKMQLSLADVVCIRAGGPRVAALGALTPREKTLPEGFVPGVTRATDPVHGGMLRTPHGLSVSGLVLPTGAALTYAVDGRFTHFLARCGVPEGLPAKAGAVFVVRGDGKEIYRSPTLTSRDEARVVHVPLKGMRSLTLLLEAASKDVPACGFWGDGVLVR